jgi:peptide/nickel transport system permease protein
VLVEYLAVTTLLCVVFSFDVLCPANVYASRTFTEEEHASQGVKHGVYVLVPFGPTEQDLVGATFKKPLFVKPLAERTKSNDGFPHVLGTDNAGRDVFTRMVYGTRISITVGLVAVGIYLTIGCIIGALAGYFGGTLDMLISRIIEIVLLFPSFFLILTLVALIGPSIYIIMVVIGITGWPTIARLIRGEILKQRASDYVSAAQALGFTHARVIFRHILPNSLSPALVAAPFGIAGAIITEAGLSLLGFGVRPPTPSWGSVLKLGSENYLYWWLVVVPSLAIFFTVTVFNLIGSGLRDAMDPRLRSTR